MNRIRNKWVREVGGLPKWVTLPTLKRENPNTSFPAKVSDATMAQFGCDPAFRSVVDPEPTATQKVVWDDLPTKVDGVWVLGYQVIEKTQEELIAELEWQDYPTARRAVVAWIDGLTAQIETLYPSAVKRRWEIEELAARAVAEDDGSATQIQLDMMTTEGGAKGRTALEHAAAVIANADRFHSIANQTNALFLATDKALQDATSPLQYPAIFAGAMAQAAPLAAAYGLTVE